MTTVNEPIKILMASDIHFGVKSMPQNEMAEAFSKTIFPLVPDLDIICLNGDLFDGVVNFDHFGFDHILEVFIMLFHLCEKHNVALRILQGTWSHDRSQCKRLVNLYRNTRCTFNFRFIDFIEVDEIEVKGRTLRFFFIRDNLPFSTAEEAVDVVREEMVKKGWDKVDYGCIHGFTDFTFPSMLDASKNIVFKQSQFPFVRKAINVGHVHKYGAVGNMYSNGSFDRLAHGEEEAKGCILYEDYPDKYKARFIRNKYAAVFDTLRIPSDAGTEDAARIIDNHIASLDTNRHINLRFEVANSELYGAIRTYIREKYQHVSVKRKTISDTDQQTIILPASILVEDQTHRECPTPENLSQFIRNYIPAEYRLSVAEIDTYRSR